MFYETKWTKGTRTSHRHETEHLFISVRLALQRHYCISKDDLLCVTSSFAYGNKRLKTFIHVCAVQLNQPRPAWLTQLCLKLKFENFLCCFFLRLNCWELVCVKIHLHSYDWSSGRPQKQWEHDDDTDGRVWETECNRNIHTVERHKQQWLFITWSITCQCVFLPFKYWPYMNQIYFPLFIRPHVTLGMTGRCLASWKHVTDNSKSQIFVL